MRSDEARAGIVEARAGIVEGAADDEEAAEEVFAGRSSVLPLAGPIDKYSPSTAS